MASFWKMTGEDGRTEAQHPYATYNVPAWHCCYYTVFTAAIYTVLFLPAFYYYYYLYHTVFTSFWPREVWDLFLNAFWWWWCFYQPFSSFQASGCPLVSAYLSYRTVIVQLYTGAGLGVGLWGGCCSGCWTWVVAWSESAVKVSCTGNDQVRDLNINQRSQVQNFVPQQ